MRLAAVVSPRESIAFPAYHSLISPALRDVARGPLRRARHNGRACTGTDAKYWCDECEQDIDDRLLAGWTRLRSSRAGELPSTREGVPVREMQTIVEWLTSPEAAYEQVSTVARLIQKRPGAEEPRGVRAARAQLVHYHLKGIEPLVVRAEAMNRGASAKPVRDLEKSAWAAPLREDPTSFRLLINAITRLRHGANDPYDIPTEVLGGQSLTVARQTLTTALNALRALRSDFYRANVTVFMDQGEFISEHTQAHDQNPEELVIQGEEKAAARRVLTERLTSEAGSYRLLLSRLCADDPPDAELIPWVASEFTVDRANAEWLLRGIIRLVGQAGMHWITRRCHETLRAMDHRLA